MSIRPSYQDLFAAFDWKRVRDALGWRGPDVSLAHSIIDRHADSADTAIVVVERGGTTRKLSYRELFEASNRFANALQRLGVRAGDRVAGLMPRGAEVIITILATLKLGAIYVPVFTGFGPDAIRYRLKDCSPQVLVTHQDVLRQVPPDEIVQLIVAGPAGAQVPAGAISFEEAMTAESASFTPAHYNRENPVALIYTSGSTGQPKGGAIAANFLAAIWPYIAYGLDLKRDDVFWPTGDPGWGYGFICYLGALAAGATVVTVVQNPSAELCLSVLAQERVTNLATTPTLLRSLMVLDEAALTTKALRLRAISSCGEPLNAKVVEFFRHIWNTTPMDHFGATEYGLPIGNYNAATMEVKPGSMGLPCPGYEMAVIDESGRKLPPGEIGLIAKKTNPDCRYWLYYWNNPAATEALMRQDWIVTGDLGRTDDDGYFWFEGRADDIIKSAGYRIGPFEVESALLKHPAVAEVAVVGKADAMRGQIVKAFVVLRDGFSPSETLDGSLVDLVKTNVGRHQYPREIEYLASLPKTETGKIQRVVLRNRS